MTSPRSRSQLEFEFAGVEVGAIKGSSGGSSLMQVGKRAQLASDIKGHDSKRPHMGEPVRLAPRTRLAGSLLGSGKDPWFSSTLDNRFLLHSCISARNSALCFTAECSSGFWEKLPDLPNGVTIWPLHSPLGFPSGWSSLIITIAPSSFEGPCSPLKFWVGVAREKLEAILDRVGAPACHR